MNPAVVCVCGGDRIPIEGMPCLRNGTSPARFNLSVLSEFVFWSVVLVLLPGSVIVGYLLKIYDRSPEKAPCILFCCGLYVYSLFYEGNAATFQSNESTAG